MQRFLKLLFAAASAASLFAQLAFAHASLDHAVPGETPFGTVSFLRLALLASALVIAFLPLRDRCRFAALVMVSALLLITQAWFGHSAEGTGLYRTMMISISGIHVLAAAAWAGGLPVLLFAVIEQRRFDAYNARENTLDICSRFSLMAIVAVALVVLSGVANAGFRVGGSFGKLWDSDYGDLLLKKIAIVAAMLALAYLNRFVLVPRLRAAGRRGTECTRALEHISKVRRQF